MATILRRQPPLKTTGWPLPHSSIVELDVAGILLPI
jgi:hypothetical protein